MAMPMASLVPTAPQMYSSIASTFPSSPGTILVRGACKLMTAHSMHRYVAPDQ